jgi:hypothetical protein
MLRLLIEWMVKTDMLNSFDIVGICSLNFIHVETDIVTFWPSYLVWNANRLFVSSKKIQHNIIIKWINVRENRKGNQEWQHWVHKKQDLSYSTFDSPEENNKRKLIGLMAVCMEHIICDTLIAMLIFDFLNVIRKQSHILYCNVRVLVWHVLFWRDRCTRRKPSSCRKSLKTCII